LTGKVNSPRRAAKHSDDCRLFSTVPDVVNKAKDGTTLNLEEILILTGPQGSGKTRAARILARLAGSPKVQVHTDETCAALCHAIERGLFLLN
jgi:MoxR-like ATPase